MAAFRSNWGITWQAITLALLAAACGGKMTDGTHDQDSPMAGAGTTVAGRNPAGQAGVEQSDEEQTAGQAGNAGSNDPSTGEAGEAGATTFDRCGTPLCGNGVKEGTETCDDGNRVGGDGCNGRCHVEPNFECTETAGCSSPPCGNGKLDSGEDCDDGNTWSGDGCSEVCRVESSFGELCRVDVPIAMCGNGKLEGAEFCDDGNATSGDGCNAACEIEWGFHCPVPGTGCVSCVGDDCPENTCGNGTLDDGERCDHGEDNGVDGLCSATCTLLPGCGNGVVEVAAGEECDDGKNTSSGYGKTCAPGCVWNAHCGDGVVQTEQGEQCDDGPSQGIVVCGYGVCLPGCRRGTYCGDGIIQSPEETCDDGSNDGADGGCTPDCQVAPSCD